MIIKAMVFWIVCAIICVSCLVHINKNDPVGLFVVRPDVEYFECARRIHGNYKFYYEQGQEEFMFERNGELCYVNTMQFRVEYIRMFGRGNEVFVGGKE